jgi:type III pantothenate kinase
MNLIIDVGNTQVKLAVYQKDQLLEKRNVPISSFGTTLMKVLEDQAGLEAAIIASVASLKESDVEMLKAKLPLHLLNYRSKLPFINDYKTPSTLGVDRIALVAAATVQFPSQNVLIIDAGSCITYDLLLADGHYVGGAISPGLMLRYKALNRFTARLPLLEKEMPDSKTGGTTIASIHIGVIDGVAHEIDGFIESYRKDYPQLKIIFTGGDAELLRDRLKNDTFANSNFLLEGLQTILELNKDRC